MRNFRKLIGGLAAGLLFLGTAMQCPADETAKAGDTAASGDKVLILPFSALNPSSDQAWLGKSIQESVVADLLAALPGRILSSTSSAGDTESALATGKSTGARYVVMGSFVSLAQDVRVTGLVLDCSTGSAITAIKSTGSPTNLFSLEDDLAAQLQRRLHLSSGSPPQAGALVSTPVPPMQSLRVVPQEPDPYWQTYGTLPTPIGQPVRSLAFDVPGSDFAGASLGVSGWGLYGPAWGLCGSGSYFGCFGASSSRSIGHGTQWSPSNGTFSLSNGGNGSATGVGAGAFGNPSAGRASAGHASTGSHR